MTDEAGSLLKLWDLNESDLETDSLLSSISYSKANNWNNDDLEVKSLEKICENCFAANDVDANWCIECGTAIIRTMCDGCSASVVIQELQQKSCKTVIPSPQSHLENKSALAKMSSIKKCSWFSDGAQTRLQQYTPQKQLTFLGLPNEVLLTILSYLTHGTLCVCMLVSKRLYMLSKDSSLWREITLYRIRNLDPYVLKQISQRSPRHLSLLECHGHISTTDIVEFFSTGGRHIETLNVELTELGPYSMDVFLQTAAKYCNKLRSISVNWLSVPEKAIQMICSLKELHVKNKPLSFEALKSIPKYHSEKLVKLDIESNDIKDIMKALNNYEMPLIEELSANFSKIHSDMEVINQMVKTFPNLKSLCLFGVIHDNVVHKLSTYSLHTLYFKRLQKSLSSYLSLRTMSTLRCLSVDSIDDENLLILCQGTLKLDFLDLSGSSVTIKCFKIILNGSFSSCLQTLKLNYCDGLSEAAIERTVLSLSKSSQPASIVQEISALITRCQSLKQLQLRGILGLSTLKHVPSRTGRKFSAMF